MALGTYADLTAAVADFLDRDDLSASVLATFVALAESRINRDVRHRLMEKRASATFDGRYTPLPTDWVETIRFTLSTTEGDVPLQLVSHTAMQEMRVDERYTSPMFFAYVEDLIEVYPSPGTGTAGEIHYRSRVPALDSATPTSTNWLLVEAPDVYLYGSLMHTAAYLAEDARVPIWAGLYSEAVDRLNTTGRMQEHSNATLRMRLRHA